MWRMLAPVILGTLGLICYLWAFDEVPKVPSPPAHPLPFEKKVNLPPDSLVIHQPPSESK